MTPLRLGVGFGIAGLLMYGLANALPSSSSKVRYINVEGATYRTTRLGSGRFEIAVWGDGILFSEAPTSPPLATLLLGQDGLIRAEGNPGLIDLIKVNMHKMPPNLFEEEMRACSKPGCFVEPP